MKKRLLLSCLIIILIGVNSCKKEYRDPLPDVATHATVSGAEILDFFNQNPNVEPAGILLSQAEQQTVNGKQVVRIPVATNAALYFTKENDSLKVYAYKWVYNVPYSDKYSGKIDIYNFQEQNFKRYTYNNGILSRITMLRKRPPVSVSSSLQTFDIWSGLAQIWCYITGGIWKDSDPDSSGSSNGEVREPGCDYSGSSDQLGSNPPQLPEDIYVDDSGDIYTTVGDGSGGGVGWGPPPCPPGSVIVNSANKNHVNNMPLPPGGGGCPTAPDGSAWLPYSVFGSNTFAASLVQTLNITDSRKEMFLILNKDIAYELYIFLQQKGDSPDIENQLNWSIDYLMANPSVSIDVFKNQFLSIPEGYDDTFDPDFWNDPNLSYAAQILPSYADFKNAYPGHNDPLYNSPSKIYNAVGGVPLSIYNNSIYELNTCALRLSRALNYSGVVIPNIPRKTYKGADNKYYFLGASNMLAWMKKTFGTPTGADHITQSQGGENGKNFPALLKNKKGIYAMVPIDSSPTGFGATGHMDLIFNANCDGGCYFYSGVYEIFIFELN